MRTRMTRDRWSQRDKKLRNEARDETRSSSRRPTIQDEVPRRLGHTFKQYYAASRVPSPQQLRLRFISSGCCVLQLLLARWVRVDYNARLHSVLELYFSQPFSQQEYGVSAEQRHTLCRHAVLSAVRLYSLIQEDGKQ